MKSFTLIMLWGAVAGAISVSGGVYGGAAVPVGDTAGDDDYNTEALEGAELAASPVLGARVVLGVLPHLGVEGAFAFHTGHHPDNDDWKQIEGMEEPVATLWPLTVGVNVLAPVGNAALYGSAGVGYYLTHYEARGETQTPFGEGDYSAELDYDEPGFYLGAGVEVRVGDFAFHADPRFHYIFSNDDYDVDYNIRVGGFSYSESYEVEKDFNDTFVNVTVGVDYYFL